MIDLQAYLEEKVRALISSWNTDGIYAISFFIDTNKAYEYRGYSNITLFSVGYNTESDCDGADALSEKRWNYAFWRQNEEPIIGFDVEGIELLFDWYRENGIDNIGFEDFNSSYDNKMRYIGKGPIGCSELLSQITAVARKLQTCGFIKDKFGAPIPIIIHDLEYPPYIIEANIEANPNGEADVFISAMKKIGITE